MSEQQGLQLVGARVIAAPPGTFERSIVIDVGAAQGVAPEMAVVNSRGVVGIVVEVTSTRARVNLLSSTETGFGVRVAQTGDRGLLSGQGSGLMQLEMLDPDPNVPLDAVIVTQAFQGSLVPGGLPIGVLEAPADGDTQGERFLEIRPYVDFTALSTVAVVVSGREEDGQFGDEEIIDLPNLAPAPTVTVVPNPNATAVPGVDFPAIGTPSPSAIPLDQRLAQPRALCRERLTVGLRAGIFALLILLAILIKTIVLPAVAIGTFRPDVLVLVVVAVALVEGPDTGLRLGFAAGLTQDLLSGGAALVGLGALVMMGIGYAAGRPAALPGLCRAGRGRGPVRHPGRGGHAGVRPRWVASSG